MWITIIVRKKEYEVLTRLILLPSLKAICSWQFGDGGGLALTGPGRGLCFSAGP